jgi:hypothetical protein
MVSHKNYRLCDSKRYRPTYNVTVYSDKERKHAAPLMTATDSAVTVLTVRNENVEHKLYTDSSSS